MHSPKQDKFYIPESLLNFPLQLSRERVITPHLFSRFAGMRKVYIICKRALQPIQWHTNVTSFFSRLVCTNFLYFTYNTWDTTDVFCLGTHKPLFSSWNKSAYTVFLLEPLQPVPLPSSSSLFSNPDHPQTLVVLTSTKRPPPSPTQVLQNLCSSRVWNITSSLTSSQLIVEEAANACWTTASGNPIIPLS